MDIVFAAMKARDAIRRFEERYGDGRYPEWYKLLEQLRTLTPEQSTATAIAAIIGNKGWTHPRCDECNTYVEVAIRMGGDPSVTLCVSCLQSSATALAAVQTAMSSLATQGQAQ